MDAIFATTRMSPHFRYTMYYTSSSVNIFSSSRPSSTSSFSSCLFFLLADWTYIQALAKIAREHYTSSYGLGVKKYIHGKKTGTKS